MFLGKREYLAIVLIVWERGKIPEGPRSHEAPPLDGQLGGNGLHCGSTKNRIVPLLKLLREREPMVVP